MKRVYATIVAAAAIALLATNPLRAASDASIDVSKLSGEQFNAYNDDNRGLIMMWFEGYYTEEDEPATIDFGDIASHLNKLLIACQANPGSKVLDLADDAMED